MFHWDDQITIFKPQITSKMTSLKNHRSLANVSCHIQNALVFMLGKTFSFFVRIVVLCRTKMKMPLMYY